MLQRVVTRDGVKARASVGGVGGVGGWRGGEPGKLSGAQGY